MISDWDFLFPLFIMDIPAQPLPVQPIAVSPDVIPGVPGVLVKQGIVSEGLFKEVQAENITTGKAIEDILLERGYVNELQLAKAKAAYYNIPFVSLSEIGAAPEALNQVPEGVARRYVLLPFAIDKSKRTLSVAMANPLDLRAVDFVEKKTGYQITPHLATTGDLEVAIAERYSQSLSTEVTAALKETSQENHRVVDVRQLGEVIREAPIAKIVETILTFAMKGRASDVHIEPQEDKTRIRYRIDGILHEKLVLPKGVHDAVVSRIKILADLKIDERRLPQDGRFTFKMGDEEVDLRVSSLPTVHGEKVVMRLLKKTQQVPTLSDLGLRANALKVFETAVTVPHGIILITGPTGSGKTTTLYSVLNKINTPKVNIVTLEDPVEYDMPGINQVQINNQAGLSFASGLRSFLRQDPNIIMVGEVRDQETAELAVQASLTGHLVFSTLHTNSAAGALPRLLDMGAEPYLLSSSMTCVMGQRVVRKVCANCLTTYVPQPSVLDNMREVLGPLFDAWVTQHKANGEIHLTKGSGCEECNGTGYSGRVGIYEVLSVSEKVGRLIMERASDADIQRQAITEGMILMKQDGYLKVLDGVTTIEEVLRVAEISLQEQGTQQTLE
jgi:type IV pilus assembly protein PilB